MNVVLDESPSCGWIVFTPTSFVLGFIVDWPSLFYRGTAGITISD
jgi:hypothetical protein